MTELLARHLSTQDHIARIRRHVVDMVCGPEGGHLGGSLSCTDILGTLYFDVMNIDPQHPDRPDRDMLFLSKGHAAVALYATLAERGYFDVEELGTFGTSSGRLMGHPVRAVPGVELPTGSLGHGLGLGLGVALADRLHGTQRRVFVVLGDGEMQEGSVWESAAVAAAQNAERLTAIVDRNGLQLSDHTESVVGLEPLAERWRSFGWTVREVDGHDQNQLRESLTSAPVHRRPTVLIADTCKGYGVAMLSSRVGSHFVTPSAQQEQRIRASLEAFLQRGGPR